VFRSFVWGGFEGASHRRADGRRIDSVGASGHERWAMLHHAMLRSLGIGTIRESLRWHMIETVPGRYDWSSAQRQLDAARANGLSVAWGLCHWGVPDHHDVMAPCWPSRLAAFAFAAAERLRAEGADIAAWVPVNEMAFWAWAGGETGGFAPHRHAAGDQLKQQLVCGHLAAVAALRAAGAAHPIMVCEPLISVMPVDDGAAAAAEAAAMIEASFAAVARIRDADPAAIDVLGLNFYPHNQWRTDGVRIFPGDPGHRPLGTLLAAAARRFPDLPLAISETGMEEPGGARWLAQIGDELEAARLAGVRIVGVCVYPVADYPGWDDGRHCPCGPIGDRNGLRFLRADHRAALLRLAAAGGERLHAP
jgi:hypothetical protein